MTDSDGKKPINRRIGGLEPQLRVRVQMAAPLHKLWVQFYGLFPDVDGRVFHYGSPFKTFCMLSTASDPCDYPACLAILTHLFSFSNKGIVSYRGENIKKAPTFNRKDLQLKAGARIHFMKRYFQMAGEQGFEPRLPDPESGVLPLHHSPTLFIQRKLILSGKVEKSRAIARLCRRSAITYSPLEKYGNQRFPRAPDLREPVHRR